MARCPHNNANHVTTVDDTGTLVCHHNGKEEKGEDNEKALATTGPGSGGFLGTGLSEEDELRALEVEYLAKEGKGK